MYRVFAAGFTEDFFVSCTAGKNRPQKQVQGKTSKVHHCLQFGGIHYVNTVFKHTAGDSSILQLYRSGLSCISLEIAPSASSNSG